jgi:hypothetical protein
MMILRISPPNRDFPQPPVAGIMTPPEYRLDRHGSKNRAEIALASWSGISAPLGRFPKCTNFPEKPVFPRTKNDLGEYGIGKGAR